MLERIVLILERIVLILDRIVQMQKKEEEELF